MAWITKERIAQLAHSTFLRLNELRAKINNKDVLTPSEMEEYIQLQEEEKRLNTSGFSTISSAIMHGIP